VGSAGLLVGLTPRHDHRESCEGRVRAVNRADFRSSYPKRLAVVVVVVVCIITVFDACGGASVRGSTQSPQASISVDLGKTHALTAPINGSNLDYAGVGQPFSSRRLISSMAAMRSGTIRYPGGAISNYWTWQSGTLNQPAQIIDNGGGTKTKPADRRVYGFTLRTLRGIVQQTGATPVFDLNVLTSNLADQLAMLKSARSLGIPVRYIELGNEFYFADANYTRVFPTATAYAKLVVRWAPQIRAAFPAAKIAAVGSLLDTTSREETWNATVLSIAGSYINALTLHDYSRSSKTTNTESLLASAFTNWQKVQRVIASIPSQYGIWVTEFNLSNEERSSGSANAGKSWLHGLYVADMVLQYDQSKRVQLDEYWDLFDHPSVGLLTMGSDPHITAAGEAIIALTNASWDADSSTPLSFRGLASLPGGAPGLVGVRFSGSQGPRSVLINLTGHTVSVSSGPAIPVHAVDESLSAKPSSVVSSTGGLLRTYGTVGASVSVPAYAIVAIGFSIPTI